MDQRRRRPSTRRPRGHHSGDEAVRPDGRAVGIAGAVAAQGVDGPTAVMDETAVDRRDPVADQGGFAVAGRARPVWAVADRLRAVSAMAARRHVGSGRDWVAGPRRRHRFDHLGCQCRLHDHAGTPACGRCLHTAAGAARATRRRAARASRSCIGSLAWRPDHETAPECRAGSKAVVDPADRGTAW